MDNTLKYDSIERVVYYLDGSGNRVNVGTLVPLTQNNVPSSTSSTKGYLDALTKVVMTFEGFYSNAYKDPVGIWTIGYGTIKYANGNKVKSGDTITKEAALAEMMHELDVKWNSIKSHIKVNLNDNQIAACISFSYNCGSSAFIKSSILRYINANDFSNAKNAFMKWINAGGKPLHLS